MIIFQVQDSVFLSAGNLTNLLVQGSVFVLLGMAEVWVLILGEIDLSVGYMAGIGAVITAILAAPPHNLPWWLAILAGLAATAAIGALWGTLVIRLRLPSFVVTLAGLLGLEGLLLYLVNVAGTGGTIRLTNNVLLDVTNGNLSPAAGWIVGVATWPCSPRVTIVRDSADAVRVGGPAPGRHAAKGGAGGRRPAWPWCWSATPTGACSSRCGASPTWS